MTDFDRGVIAAKLAISAKIKEMACYFDKFECYGGQYASISGRESLAPEDIARIITDVEIEE